MGPDETVVAIRLQGLEEFLKGAGRALVARPTTSKAFSGGHVGYKFSYPGDVKTMLCQFYPLPVPYVWKVIWSGEHHCYLIRLCRSEDWDLSVVSKCRLLENGTITPDTRPFL